MRRFAEACPDCPDCADSEISCRTRQPASKRHCKHGDKADERLHFSCLAKLNPLNPVRGPGVVFFLQSSANKLTRFNKSF